MPVSTRTVSTVLFVSPILVLAACSAGTAGGGEAASASAAIPAAPSARAELTDEAGAKKGEVRVTQQDGNLVVTLTAMGISPGLHGAHIHMTGKCEAPGFTSAGGHWNPAGKHHGLQNPMGSHKGDLPNLEVAADGTGSLSYIVPEATIEGGAAALLDADGAAFVIHAGPDDMVSDPAGNAGGRVACGIFVKD